ncbi:MAG TPA: DUF2269 family protein [Candidatus Eisenbacteria bacterium]|nr:DUF2269 family protein [Candidatus Eisenbacteria bacterium]
MAELFRALHVIGGVVLVGELLFSGLWLGRALARGDTNLRPYALATMAWTSKSYALPAILVNLIAGLALIHFARTPLAHALWLWIALGLYVVVTGLWHGVLIPRRKKMAALFGEPEKGAKGGAAAAPAGGAGASDAEFEAMARGWLGVNAVTVLLLFAILVLMVWRPLI